MSIYIASDHAGFMLKQEILTSVNCTDLGPTTPDSVDYIDYACILCENIKEGDKGILICGTGIGMSIAANRFSTIRAALCFNQDIATLSRQHNDANVLCLGARFLDTPLAIDIVRVFLKTDFSGEERHKQRIKKLGDSSCFC